MTDSSSAAQAQWQKLFEYMLGYQASWIVDIGLKSGLFRDIADAGAAGIGDDQLAERRGLAPRYVAVWCRAAYAYELLDWDEQSGYRLAPQMETLLLDSSDPRFLGGRFQLFAALNEDFRAFPAYLESGDVWPRSEHDPWLLEALKNNTKPDAPMVTEHVLPQAPRTLARLEVGGTILDVGAGAGFAAAHYAVRFPCARVVGLEFDRASMELAQTTVTQAGLAERVEIRHADANLLDEEGVYTLVTLNISLHETGGPAEYRNVLARVRRALAEDSTVVVSELPYPDSPRAYRDLPIYKMLAGVQVHETIVGCGAITQRQLRDLLIEAGFSNVRVADQPILTRFVMLAEK